MFEKQRENKRVLVSVSCNATKWYKCWIF